MRSSVKDKMVKINDIRKLRTFKSIYNDDDKSILDCLIELSHDRLINQILYMLSQIPIEVSF
jgi:hypothetical protein